MHECAHIHVHAQVRTYIYRYTHIHVLKHTYIHTYTPHTHIYTTYTHTYHTQNDNTPAHRGTSVDFTTVAFPEERVLQEAEERNSKGGGESCVVQHLVERRGGAGGAGQNDAKNYRKRKREVKDVEMLRHSLELAVGACLHKNESCHTHEWIMAHS